MPNEFTPYALVADDDGLIRIDAADILEAAGFRVHGARSYHEALANLRQAGGSIQLSPTDVQMPPGEMNGFYLAQECAKHWPDINILVASRHDSAKRRRSAKRRCLCQKTVQCSRRRRSSAGASAGRRKAGNFETAIGLAKVLKRGSHGKNHTSDPIVDRRLTPYRVRQ